MENAKYATVFSSGMAAITALASTLKEGDLILAEENIYGSTYRLFEQVLAKFKVKTEYLDFTKKENYKAINKKKPAFVWIESPTNPLLKIIDIKEVSKFTRRSDSILIVDNTFASSYFQSPLKLGADISLSSTTKYINGHSDCLGGCVVTNDGEWNQKMIFAQKALGLNPSPFDAWLISRGVKTLALRMEKHLKNATKFAKYLEEHPLVKRVHFPFLQSHPQFELAKKQMRGASGIVTAEFNLSISKIRNILEKLKLFKVAVSLGGVESLVEHPSSMTHFAMSKKQREKVGITDGLIRFSLGIEDVNDLISDFENACFF